MLNVMSYRKFLGRDPNAASQTKPTIDNFTRFFRTRHNINHHFGGEERGSVRWRERLPTDRPSAYHLYVMNCLFLLKPLHTKESGRGVYLISLRLQSYYFPTFFCIILKLKRRQSITVRIPRPRVSSQPRPVLCKDTFPPNH